MDVEILDSDERAAAAAADAVAHHLVGAVEARRAAAVAVSGGTTPARMFEELAKLELPWHSIHLFQVDERLAPEGDPARNLSMLRERLLAHVDLPVANLHPMPVGVASLGDAARRYQEVLESVCGRPAVLDVVHLGLGDDGHTASLFPGDPALAVDDADVAPTDEHGGRRRLTLTRPALDRARLRLWLVAGRDKRAALRGLLEGSAGPAATLRRDDTLVFADREAAGDQPT